MEDTKDEQANEDLKKTMELIASSLSIDYTYEELNQDELIYMISQRVDYLLEHEKDLLMSYLYRLDIAMKKINNVLKVKDIIPPHQSLAVLIFQRQLERVRTKRSIKVEPIKGWEF
jgi:hypothetical protein